jgi:hypothetical protein
MEAVLIYEHSDIPAGMTCADYRRSTLRVARRRASWITEVVRVLGGRAQR